MTVAFQQALKCWKESMRQSCGGPLRNEGGKATGMEFTDNQAGRGSWHSDSRPMASEFSDSWRETLSLWVKLQVCPEFRCNWRLRAGDAGGGLPGSRVSVCLLQGECLAFPGGSELEAHR